jgi:hypothetical protein
LFFGIVCKTFGGKVFMVWCLVFLGTGLELFEVLWVILFGVLWGTRLGLFRVFNGVWGILGYFGVPVFGLFGFVWGTFWDCLRLVIWGTLG